MTPCARAGGCRRPHHESDASRLGTVSAFTVEPSLALNMNLPAGDGPCRRPPAGRPAGSGLPATAITATEALGPGIMIGPVPAADPASQSLA